MVGVLIVSHGRLAEALISSVQLKGGRKWPIFFNPE